jgi:hypothetical protein
MINKGVRGQRFGEVGKDWREVVDLTPGSGANFQLLVWDLGKPIVSGRCLHGNDLLEITISLA